MRKSEKWIDSLRVCMCVSLPHQSIVYLLRLSAHQRLGRVKQTLRGSNPQYNEHGDLIETAPFFDRPIALVAIPRTPHLLILVDSSFLARRRVVVVNAESGQAERWFSAAELFSHGPPPTLVDPVALAHDETTQHVRTCLCGAFVDRLPRVQRLMLDLVTFCMLCVCLCMCVYRY